MNIPQQSDDGLLNQPVRSLQYMLNQIAIQYQTLPRLVVDGIFGERTLEAVMLFQRDFKLPVTGVVDNDTWDAITRVYEETQLFFGPPPTLRVLPNGNFSAALGDQCPPILIVQAMLTSLSKVVDNFSVCSSSGVNDDETGENLRKIQQLSGLPVTGKLDRSTWTFLAQLYHALVTRS